MQIGQHQQGLRWHMKQYNPKQPHYQAYWLLLFLLRMLLLFKVQLEAAHRPSEEPGTPLKLRRGLYTPQMAIFQPPTVIRASHL